MAARVQHLHQTETEVAQANDDEAANRHCSLSPGAGQEPGARTRRGRR
jgi:hypothetical protein